MHDEYLPFHPSEPDANVPTYRSSRRDTDTRGLGREPNARGGSNTLSDDNRLPLGQSLE